jgi:hypothetical protein
MNNSPLKMARAVRNQLCRTLPNPAPTCQTSLGAQGAETPCRSFFFLAYGLLQRKRILMSETVAD